MSSTFSSLLQYLPLLILSSPTTTNLSLISAALDIDALHLALGCQAPLSLSLLNNGEFPACAAMTTGYVFRVENEATVHFLQAIGTTGALTHLKVGNAKVGKSTLDSAAASFVELFTTPLIATFVHYLITALFHSENSNLRLLLPVFALVLTSQACYSRGGQIPAINAMFSAIANWLVALLALEGFTGGTLLSRPFKLSLLCLFVSRVVFAYVLAQRTTRGWHGASEPGVKGSLLVLLSQDRWVRLDGDADDLKVVTSGSWLQPMTGWQDILSQMSCFLVWIGVLICLSAGNGEKVFLVVMILGRHIATSWSVSKSRLMKDGVMMKGRKVGVDTTTADKGVKKYGRRLEMAEDLIKEFERRDWAEQMGMVKPKDGRAKEVIM